MKSRPTLWLKRAGKPKTLCRRGREENHELVEPKVNATEFLMQFFLLPNLVQLTLMDGHCSQVKNVSVPLMSR